jgi:hypothetical protein
VGRFIIQILEELPCTLKIMLMDPSGILNDTVTDLINALPGNSSVNSVKHATMEEAVFSVARTYGPIDWLNTIT